MSGVRSSITSCCRHEKDVNTSKMNTLFLSLLVAVVAAERLPLSYDAPAPHTSSPVQQIPIIRDERVHPAADGIYSFDVETGDGIVRSESGGPGGAQQGTVSFTFPDGQIFNLQFVADVNGYQPQSPFLPVAPAFPHPIPAHALEQIERGRLELEARAREEQRQSSSQGQAAPVRHYGQPQ
ncbi:cuticle protein AM1199-like [Penaeus chinensis]|uniref:cuticle protein AM1199-like n=1 Tax=Penaeus chinensis TaxID=139456 RepID=UPI001FB85031|nr:cuticle protein AM1199-like [Penaeus chinensis]